MNGCQPTQQISTTSSNTIEDRVCQNNEEMLLLYMERMLMLGEKKGFLEAEKLRVMKECVDLGQNLDLILSQSNTKFSAIKDNFDVKIDLGREDIISLSEKLKTIREQSSENLKWAEPNFIFEMKWNKNRFSWDNYWVKNSGSLCLKVPTDSGASYVIDYILIELWDTCEYFEPPVIKTIKLTLPIAPRNKRITLASSSNKIVQYDPNSLFDKKIQLYSEGLDGLSQEVKKEKTKRSHLQNRVESLKKQCENKISTYRRYLYKHFKKAVKALDVDYRNLSAFKEKLEVELSKVTMPPFDRQIASLATLHPLFQRCITPTLLSDPSERKIAYLKGGIQQCEFILEGISQILTHVKKSAENFKKGGEK